MQLTQDVTLCTKCEIGKSSDERGMYRTLYRGVLNPTYMFIGEGPGKMEEQLGRPFVGRAGAILQSILDELSITSYGITNIIRCRATILQPTISDRRPSKQEVSNCYPFLERTISILEPKVLIAMGLTAIRVICDPDPMSVRLSHGFWYPTTFSDKQYPALATYHPAAVLYDYSLRKVLKDDISKVGSPQEL